MKASSLSEPGAFRMAVAIALAAIAAIVVGVVLTPLAGAIVALLAVVAGIAFESHHLFA